MRTQTFNPKKYKSLSIPGKSTLGSHSNRSARAFLFLGGFEMELIRKTGTHLSKSGKYLQSYGLFLCSHCGKEVERQLGTGKRYQSCGCVRDKLAGESNTKHGNAKKGHKTRLYGTWCNMKVRCYNKNSDRYKDYGGRNIKIYKTWKNDFAEFRDWALNNGYEENLTIDRIDNNKDYEPSNCKFSTYKEQNKNKRTNRLITFKGETHCVKEWAEILGVKVSTLYSRLNIYKWNVEKTLTKKIKGRSNAYKLDDRL